jgi:tripartite-type tricarboxylate transporter receptor subunit TctC
MTLFAALRRIIAVVSLAAVASIAPAQQAYPSKPIRLIIPFPPGGGTDPIARVIGQKLTESWGQPVISDNRPGGSTIIATEAVAKAAPDGYTLLLTPTGTFATAPLLLPAPYDVVRDFAPVAAFAASEWVLVVNPSVPAKTLQEFIAYAKSRPDINYASAGTGNPNHLAGELLNMLTGTKMLHIPYKGTGPAITDLIGGRVQMHIATPISVAAHIRSGKLRALAVSGKTRSSILPEVPTFDEAGLHGFDMRVVYGLIAPRGTPPDVLAKLSGEMARIVTTPEFKSILVSQGLEPVTAGPEQFAEIIKTDTTKFANIIKTANIKIGNN